MPIQKQMHPVG